ncbi:MAG: MFS transporter, partial [Pseudomonadota bacterium]
VQTHLGPVPLWLMVAFSTLFFILVPGRMVPAMAIVTSAAQPRLRGTFLAMVGSVQQLAAGMATYLGGLIIAVDAGGQIVRYDSVGYLAIGTTFAAIGFVGLIRMHTGPAEIVALK